ncbi:hypothetical protein LNJ08_12750 [Tenacibaculum finnmarkense genomovar ulcerans]|uniref:hypothetical protein n=1 Tax=Tenacibaculum finnmarkense TaxID=2781243 RepID=UPI001E486BD9|nr:hypothetical protein [Tenacibaculum finnmarkense]MCD8455259.1 hypothetical protein [Tenacibaculum finnmarkense genomovar ulcerans]
MFLEITSKSEITVLQVTDSIESKAQELIKEFDNMTLKDSVLLLKRLNTLVANKSLVVVKP